ncbi:MAG TPA: sensor histidine kinase [Streptosporangiaceae bacterium]|nr:sensor histidine kinase [Streptosporangiaceae bacterium]
MNQAVGWRRDWTAGPRRLASSPHAPVVAGTLLAVFAVAQAIALPPTKTGIDFAQGVGLVLLALFSTLPLGLLWAYPAGAGVAVGAASVLSLSAFHTLPVASLIAQLIVLYRLGRNGAQLLAAGLALPYLVLALLAPTGPAARILAVLLVALGPAAAWAGAARRARSEAVEHSAAREVITGSLLEHMARGERARVSRELHDVVAHHISMIAVQAETARLTTPGMPAAGAQRLSAIGDTARAALTEMRRLLGVLREDTEGSVAHRQPQPGLRQLRDLIEEAREASGSGVRLIIAGPVGPLDPGIELAAYRIIQEALTNTRRHAEGAAVDVELYYTADALLLRVRDNGPGPAQPGPLDPLASSKGGGHGLLGMRERAAAVGGELRAGAGNAGGFVVEASLPIAAEAAA